MCIYFIQSEINKVHKSKLRVTHFLDFSTKYIKFVELSKKSIYSDKP